MCKKVYLNRVTEMVSFKLGKEFEKYVFRLVTSVGQSLSPHEESNL